MSPAVHKAGSFSDSISITEAYKAHTSRGAVQLNRDSFSFHRSAGTSLQPHCTTWSTQVGIHGGVAFTSIPCTTERASLHSASRSKPFARATQQTAYRGDRGNLQCYHQCQTSPALIMGDSAPIRVKGLYALLTPVLQEASPRPLRSTSKSYSISRIKENYVFNLLASLY